MIVYAPSFKTVVFALQQFPIEELEFITPNSAIKNFAEAAGIKVYFRKDEIDLSIRGLKEYRDYCKEMLKDFSGKEILFGFITFDYWGLFQLLELRKRNKVFFHQIDYNYTNQTEISRQDFLKPKNLSLSNFFQKKYRAKLFVKFVFAVVSNVWLDVFYIGNEFVLGFSIARCKKYFQPFKIKHEPEIFSANQKKLLSETADCEILFIDGGEKYLSIPDSLLKFLSDYFSLKGKTISIKEHPNHKMEIAFPSNYSFVQKDIPAELLIGKPKVVLGVVTAALIGFSNSHLTIALAKLVDWPEEERKLFFINDMRANKNILMPESIEELKFILDSVFN
jgi:hypothetical protein